MFRLMMVLHAVIATTLMGIAVTATLVAGATGGRPVILSALAGFALSFPVSWLVARQILAKMKS